MRNQPAMRSRNLVLGIALALATTSTAAAEPLNSESRFGIGLELGAPTGLAGKYFFGGSMAVQGGVGVIRDWGWYRYEDALHIHAEAVWHPVVLGGNRDVLVPLHVGVGARLLDMEGLCWNGNDWVRCDNDTYIGVRAPVGVSFLFGKVPMDLFVELALVVDLIEIDDDDRMYDHDRAGIDGVLGGRFYF